MSEAENPYRAPETSCRPASDPSILLGLCCGILAGFSLVLIPEALASRVGSIRYGIVTALALHSLVACAVPFWFRRRVGR